MDRPAGQLPVTGWTAWRVSVVLQVTLRGAIAPANASVITAALHPANMAA
eukprot:CAMPEP_0180665780 /NCGR_PEP_ID=MMETSP1037_2-20121125/61466_1 /TAXON_ID=632150 /ORGANISM="Azadinium spinosum, Strain 3D9" /LENGTH=49 /DNA_ID= /DNA_START= /DNA_END= /DNA_ORIENTATION=